MTTMGNGSLRMHFALPKVWLLREPKRNHSSLQEGEMQPYKTKCLDRGEEYDGRGEYTVKLGQ